MYLKIKLKFLKPLRKMVTNLELTQYMTYGVVVLAFAFIIDLRIGLLLSSVFFGLFYFLCIRKMTTRQENYKYINPCTLPYSFASESKQLGEVHNMYRQKDNCKQLSMDCTKFNRDPFKTKPVVVNQHMKSINNELQGGQNPKTLIPPMVIKPMYSLGWRDNDLIVPNVLKNKRSNEDLYLSGYLTEICDYQGEGKADDFNLNTADDIIEDFTYPAADYTSQNWSDAVNTIDGYNPKQWENSKFPANLPQGNCNQVSEFSELHDKMFTHTVQPGLTYRDDVIEPINSNIGISFQQEFLPRTFDYTPDGNVHVVDHDPNFAPLPNKYVGEPEEPLEYNVYDPRFTGYGTSYRNYVDETTGQPRFPYDDVNAIRMPNYIVRSKIDTHDFADKYGPVRQPQSLNDIRSKVEGAFLEDSMQHRNDLMTKLMRKRNAEMWQLRQAPINRNAGRSLGGH
jgi:hypothetical protein